MAQKAKDNTRTVGFALTPCIIPEVGHPNFTLEENEMAMDKGYGALPELIRQNTEPGDVGKTLMKAGMKMSGLVPSTMGTLMSSGICGKGCRSGRPGRSGRHVYAPGDETRYLWLNLCIRVTLMGIHNKIRKSRSPFVSRRGGRPFV